MPFSDLMIGFSAYRFSYSPNFKYVHSVKIPPTTPSYPQLSLNTSFPFSPCKIVVVYSVSPMPIAIPTLTELMGLFVVEDS